MGNICERFARRDLLLGSYVHQESLLNDVNDTNVFRGVWIESLLFYFVVILKSVLQKQCW